MTGRRTVAVASVLAVVVAVGAAGYLLGHRAGNAAAPLVDVVTCSVWTRPNDGQQPTSAGELRIDWGTASKMEGVSSEQHASGDGLSLTARYAFPFPPEGHTLSIAVTDHRGRRIHQVLFQIWAGPSDQFGTRSGGFTGLNYANDPETGAEMQYSCAVG